MAGVSVLRYLSIPNIHPMLLSSQLRYALYGTVLSASLISLSSWAFAAAADGVFGDYFRNIINTPCTYWYEVITGFDVSAGTSYGTKTCTNIATVLGNISNAVNVGIGTLSPVAKLDVAGRIIGNYLTIRPENTTVEWGEILLSRAAGMTKNAHIDNSADRFRIHNGSSEMMSADLLTGNVGIGTATPGAKLEVAGLIRSTNNGSAYLQWGDDVTLNDVNITNTLGVIGIQDSTKGTLQLWSNAASYIAGSAGNVGIGTTTPGAKLEVAWWGFSMKWGEIIIQRPVTTGGWARWLHYTPNNSYDSTNAGLAGIGLLGGGTTESSIYLTFGTAPWSSSKGIQILANGNVGIWTTAPTEKLHVIGNIKVSNNIEANQYYYTSDRRLKEDITPLKNSLDKILSLNGYTYNWKSTGHKDIWVIAQEVETIFPELVKTNPDTGFKSVEYGNLVAPLIEAIKEQQAEIEILRTELAGIKSQLK